MFQDLIVKYRNCFQKRFPLTAFLHKVRKKKLLNLLLREKGGLAGEFLLSPTDLQLTSKIPFPFLVNNKYESKASAIFTVITGHIPILACSMHPGLDCKAPQICCPRDHSKKSMSLNLRRVRCGWCPSLLCCLYSCSMQAAGLCAAIRSTESNWKATRSLMAVYASLQSRSMLSYSYLLCLPETAFY